MSADQTAPDTPKSSSRALRKAGTPTSPPSPPTNLTLAQQSAVDLLAAGNTDTETAKLLKLHRVTVTRWRLYSPEFRAALAVRRANVWGAAADQLRALIPQALDVLAEALDDAEHRVPVALALLKLAGPLPLVPADPTDPEDYVLAEVERSRARAPSSSDRLRAQIDGLSSHEEQTAEARAKLAHLAAEVPKQGEGVPPELPALTAGSTPATVTRDTRST